MEDIMQISSARRAGPKYRFYEKGPDRANSFVIMPKSMIDQKEMGHIKADWSRVVAFGDVAEIINSMVDDGVTLFKLAKGRVRNNDLERDDGTVFESAEIVVEKLDTKEWAKLLKKFKGAGTYDGSLPDAA